MRRRKALLSTMGLMGAVCFGVIPKEAEVEKSLSQFLEERNITVLSNDNFWVRDEKEFWIVVQSELKDSPIGEKFIKGVLGKHPEINSIRVLT